MNLGSDNTVIGCPAGKVAQVEPIAEEPHGNDMCHYRLQFCAGSTNSHSVLCPQEAVIANVDEPMEWAMDVSDSPQSNYGCS